MSVHPTYGVKLRISSHVREARVMMSTRVAGLRKGRQGAPHFCARLLWVCAPLHVCLCWKICVWSVSKFTIYIRSVWWATSKRSYIYTYKVSDLYFAFASQVSQSVLCDGWNVRGKRALAFRSNWVIWWGRVRCVSPVSVWDETLVRYKHWRKTCALYV